MAGPRERRVVWNEKIGQSDKREDGKAIAKAVLCVHIIYISSYDLTGYSSFLFNKLHQFISPIGSNQSTTITPRTPPVAGPQQTTVPISNIPYLRICHAPAPLLPSRPATSVRPVASCILTHIHLIPTPSSNINL